MEAFFTAHPGIPYQWQDVDLPNQCTLVVPSASSDGFEIEIDVHAGEVMLYCGNFHDHYHWGDGNHVGVSLGQFVQSFVNLVESCLSGELRLHEYLSNSKGYKWYLESETNGVWSRERGMALVLFHYFGKRSHKYYRNQVIPRTGSLDEKSPEVGG